MTNFSHTIREIILEPAAKSLSSQNETAHNMLLEPLCHTRSSNDHRGPEHCLQKPVFTDHA